MNNAKLWLVVKPTVGIPMILTAVVLGSVAVHIGVLTNTSWMGDYWKGVPIGTGDGAAETSMLIDPLMVEPDGGTT